MLQHLADNGGYVIVPLAGWQVFFVFQQTFV